MLTPLLVSDTLLCRKRSRTRRPSQTSRTRATSWDTLLKACRVRAYACAVFRLFALPQSVKEKKETDRSNKSYVLGYSRRKLETSMLTAALLGHTHYFTPVLSGAAIWIVLVLRGLLLQLAS